jgi:hypothetical protein
LHFGLKDDDLHARLWRRFLIDLQVDLSSLEADPEAGFGGCVACAFSDRDLERRIRAVQGRQASGISGENSRFPLVEWCEG